MAVCSAMCCGWSACSSLSGLAVSQAPRRLPSSRTKEVATQVYARTVSAGQGPSCCCCCCCCCCFLDPTHGSSASVLSSPALLLLLGPAWLPLRSQVLISEFPVQCPSTLSNRLALARPAALVRAGTPMGNSVRCCELVASSARLSGRYSGPDPEAWRQRMAPHCFRASTICRITAVSLGMRQGNLLSRAATRPWWYSSNYLQYFFRAYGFLSFSYLQS